jgi:hypothetical protein
LRASKPVLLYATFSTLELTPLAPLPVRFYPCLATVFENTKIRD